VEVIGKVASHHYIAYCRKDCESVLANPFTNLSVLPGIIYLARPLFTGSLLWRTDFFSPTPYPQVVSDSDTTYPHPGLTLCLEVLTLEGGFRLVCCQSCGGVPEATITRFDVGGLVGAARAVLCGAGPGSARAGSAESACAETGSAGSGFARSDFTESDFTKSSPAGAGAFGE